MSVHLLAYLYCLPPEAWVRGVEHLLASASTDWAPRALHGPEIKDQVEVGVRVKQGDARHKQQDPYCFLPAIFGIVNIAQKQSLSPDTKQRVVAATKDDIALGPFCPNQENKNINSQCLVTAVLQKAVACTVNEQWQQEHVHWRVVRGPGLWVCDRQPGHAPSKRNQVLPELEPQLRKLVAVHWEAAPSQALQQHAHASG